MRRIFDDQGLIDDPTPPTIFRDAGESHAKVKARDIIDGWPMSRSTCGGFHGTTEEYIWTEHFFLMIRHNDLEYITARMDEIQQTADYHLNQRIMIDDCIRSMGSLELFRATLQGGYTVRVREPGYWRNEVSGKLAPVVVAFINRDRLTPDGVVLMKAYFKQWIYSDVWQAAAEIEALRRMIDEVATQHGLDAWVSKALDAGIDPL